MTSPDASVVLDLIEAFRRSKTMFTAVRMGVFDRLPSTAEDLAKALKVDAGALLRLLDGCAGLGLLEKRDGVFSNTPAADAYLRKKSPARLTGYIEYSDQVLYRLWDHLEGAVKEGTHRWNAAFGLEGPIFNSFFRTPDTRREFLTGMHGLGLLCSPAVVRVFNLNRFHHLADLGGATGHLAIAACERYGGMRATVFDLAPVIEEARPHVGNSPAAARIELRGGDFFADPLPEADLYALGRIVHDWSEPKIRTLFAKIHAALPVGGGILVVEKLLDEDGTGPVHAQMQSLNMLVCTEGRERSASEYRALLEEAGFRQVDARRTGAPIDAVLALKM
jgi:acetylserotonin O-methyltransferase